MGKPFETDFTGPDHVLAEGAGARLGFVVRDDAGVALPGASLTSCRLTLTDVATGAVINGRDAVDVLNAGPGTIDAEGNGVLLLAGADNAIVGHGPREDHEALLEWAWVGGASPGKHRILLRVENLAQVP
jgi:hypothetical protein